MEVFKTITSRIALLIALLVLAGTASAQRLSSVCVFEYDGKPYQWSRMQDDVWFSYINDSGEAVGENLSENFPRIYFFEANSFFGRQVVAFTEFSNEYDAWIQMWPVTLNDDGIVFGNVFLANPSPDPDTGFRRYSNGFSFGWSLDEGFVDLASVVEGITGRGEIGYSTLISLLNDPKFITENPPPIGSSSGTQTSKPFPFPVRETQQHIPQDMLDEILSQCGSIPFGGLASITDSNENLEFISGKNIVRFPAANLGVQISHWWYNTAIYNGNTGQLGDALNFRISIDNFGALDVYSLDTRLEVIDQNTNEILYIAIADPGPDSLNAGDRADDFYYFTYTIKPGTYAMKFVTTGQDEFASSFEISSSTRTFTIESSEPLINADIRFTDGRSRSVIGETETVDITLEISTTDGVNPIDDIVFTDLFGGAPNLDIVEAPDIAQEGFSLEPNSSRSLHWKVKPNSGGNWQLSTTVSGRNADGILVSDSDGLTGRIVSEDLVVEIALNPEEEMTQEEEIGGDPEPIEFTVDASVCNNTGKTITQIRMENMSIRSNTGGALFVDKLSGPVPFTNLQIGTLEKYSCVPIEQSKFVATDDGFIEVDAMVVGVSDVGAELIDFDEKVLKIKPKYFFEILPEVIVPETGATLPAGVQIRIAGRLKNLSNTHELEVGPLFVQLDGNAGSQSFAWNPTGTEPDAFLIPEIPRDIEPGGEAEFSVRVTTSASDPRHNGTEEGKPTGGTRAVVNFVPWAIAEDPEGERTVIKPDSTETYNIPDEVKNTEADLELMVSIDDSIAIPVRNDIAIAAGVTLGGIEAGYEMGIGLLKAPFVLLDGFASLLWATGEYQWRLWDSFTEEEKVQFTEDVGLWAGTVLYRHYEMAMEIDPQQLLDQVNALVLEQMTDMAEEWELGDYTTVATQYSKHASTLVGEVAFSAALWKLGKYKRAAEVLNRGQAARNARNAALLRSANVGDDLVDLKRVEQILLTAEPGVEATIDDIVKLFGYTPDEIARLQANIDKFPGTMMTTRSKSARSVFWREIFNAQLKPEALKAKGVSWLDELLGYPKIYNGYSSVGAMVFKKPDFMVLAEQSGRSWINEIDAFLGTKNILPGDAIYDQAVERLLLRADEWVKYEKTYKKASEVGYLDVSFDFGFNSISDDTARMLRRTNTKGPFVGAKKYKGFRMRKISDPDSPYETNVMEMHDKNGRWRPVTGDIDNTGFTRTDSTAVDELLHSEVVETFYGSGLIEHGDSATAKIGVGGLDFIAKQAEGFGGVQELVLQWKAGESLPRLVRFNKEKSVWNGPRDFRLHYDGGFVDAGNSVARQGPKPPLNIPNPPPASVAAPPTIALSISSPPYDGSANMGRCRLIYSAAEDASSLILGSSGRISNVGPDGTITPSELHDVCFGEGDIVTYSIKPSSMLSDDVAQGATHLDVFENGSTAATTGASTVSGFEPDQMIIIGADTDHAETRRIVALGPIELDRPLDFAHGVGEVVVVVEQSMAPELEEDEIASLDRFLDALTGLDGSTSYDGGTLGFAVGGVSTRISFNTAEPTGEGEVQGLEVGGDGKLIFKTDSGQTLSGYTDLLDPDLLALALADQGLVYHRNSSGRIVAGGEYNTGPTLLSMIPALVITAAPGGTPTGLQIIPNDLVPNQLLLNLVSDITGIPQQQLLYPAPIDWQKMRGAFLAIPGIENVTLSLEGLITVSLEGINHVGMMDYTVRRATGDLGDTTVAIGDDVNGDGLPDILVTYADGNQQTMYYLGTR